MNEKGCDSGTCKIPYCNTCYPETIGTEGTSCPNCESQKHIFSCREGIKPCDCKNLFSPQPKETTEEDWEEKLDAHYPFVSCRASFHDQIDLQPGTFCLRKMIKKLLQAARSEAKREERERAARILLDELVGFTDDIPFQAALELTKRKILNAPDNRKPENL